MTGEIDPSTQPVVPEEARHAQHAVSGQDTLDLVSCLRVVWFTAHGKGVLRELHCR